MPLKVLVCPGFLFFRNLLQHAVNRDAFTKHKVPGSDSAGILANIISLTGEADELSMLKVGGLVKSCARP